MQRSIGHIKGYLCEAHLLWANISLTLASFSCPVKLIVPPSRAEPTPLAGSVCRPSWTPALAAASVSDADPGGLDPVLNSPLYPIFKDPPHNCRPYTLFAVLIRTLGALRALNTCASCSRVQACSPAMACTLWMTLPSSNGRPSIISQRTSCRGYQPFARS